MHKATVTRPIRSSSRSQTRAYAYHVVTSPEPQTIEGLGLIRFAEMRFAVYSYIFNKYFADAVIPR